jgi:hypothetical protein
MTTTRYFEVTFKNITECGECPYCDEDYEYCKKAGSHSIYFENRSGITDSCPMYPQSFVKDEKK